MSFSDTFSLIRLTSFRTKMSCSELLALWGMFLIISNQRIVCDLTFCDPQKLGDPCPNLLPEIRARYSSGHPASIPQPILEAPCRFHQLLVSLSDQFAFWQRTWEEPLRTLRESLQEVSGRAPSQLQKKGNGGCLGPEESCPHQCRTDQPRRTTTCHVLFTGLFIQIRSINASFVKRIIEPTLYLQHGFQRLPIHCTGRSRHRLRHTARQRASTQFLTIGPEWSHMSRITPVERGDKDPYTIKR